RLNLSRRPIAFPLLPYCVSAQMSPPVVLHGSLHRTLRLTEPTTSHPPEWMACDFFRHQILTRLQGRVWHLSRRGGTRIARSMKDRLKGGEWRNVATLAPYLGVQVARGIRAR